MSRSPLELDKRGTGKPAFHLVDDSGQPTAREDTVLSEGEYLDHYKIVRKLGRGGMADIYEAGDTRLRRMVALKVLRPNVTERSDCRFRFEQEARTLLALNHPNIVTIYDFVAGRDLLYTVLELLWGETLRQRLDRGTLCRSEVVCYGRQIAEGLAAIHAHAIVHGDLKPENIFITTTGRIKILDFGLSKPSASFAAGHNSSYGLLAGTLAYMAPEQLRREPTDHRADIFAFGTILIEMLTNRNPFRCESPAATISAILGKEPFQPDQGYHPDHLIDRIALDCVQKRPERRSQSAQELALVLGDEAGSLL
ncbi:MAG TPA: serine/threonine-protein kinase [Vicinamibacteria bacterium]|jgi:serine/threonine protein kinase